MKTQNDNKKLIEEYYAKTGQTRQYLYSGSFAYGTAFILKELVPQALKENKMIVWKDDLNALDKMSYSFKKIKNSIIKM